MPRFGNVLVEIKISAWGWTYGVVDAVIFGSYYVDV
jgi:hypothetical protein